MDQPFSFLPEKVSYLDCQRFLLATLKIAIIFSFAASVEG